MDLVGQPAKACCGDPGPPSGGQPPAAGAALRGSPLGRQLVAGLLLLFTGGGAGFAGPLVFGAADGETRELAAAVAENRERLDAYESEVDRARNMAVLALEISVDGHRDLTDLIVKVAKLDHPDFDPELKNDRLRRRLDRGEQLLDDLPPTRQRAQ